MKPLFAFIIGFVAALAPFAVSAQGISQLQQWSATTSPYAAIAPTVPAKNLYAPYSSATTSNIYATTFCLILDTCRTTWPTGGGASFAWPFTVSNGRVSTSTTLDFGNGFVSQASSTVAGQLTVVGDDISVAVRRTDNNGAASVDYIPAGTVSPSNVQFSSGLYAGSNALQLWYYDGTNDHTNIFKLTNTGFLQLASTTASKINGVIIVDGVHYPATGAGVKAAIADQAAAGGGEVYVPAGTYNFLAADEIDAFGSKIKLHGSGASTTIFVAAGVAKGIIHDDTNDSVPSQRADDEISGITFDVNNLSVKNPLYMGASQNLYIHDNVFRNANAAWNVGMGSIGGTLGSETDAQITASASTNLRFIHNTVENSANGTLESVICVNCRDSHIEDNTFRNISQGAAQLAVYGYGQNVIVSGNVFASSSIKAAYIQESDSVSFTNNQVYVTDGTANLNLLEIINAHDISVQHNIFRGPLNNGGFGASGVLAYDNVGPTFDGHKLRTNNSYSLNISNNQFINHYYGVRIPSHAVIGTNNVAQQDITVESNTFSGGQFDAIAIGDPKTTGMARIHIFNNIASTTKTTGEGAITLTGSTTATSKLSDIDISGNYTAPSSAGGNSSGIYVDGASNVRIFNNSTQSTGKGTFQDIQVTANTASVFYQTITSLGFGIATSTPYLPFSVVGDGIFKGYLTLRNDDESLTIQRDDNTQSATVDYVPAGTISPTNIHWSTGLLSDTNTNNWAIDRYDGTNDTYDFVVRNNGNVGVATTTPGSKFSVAGNSLFGGNIIATGTVAIGTAAARGTLSVFTSGGSQNVDLALRTDGTAGDVLDIGSGGAIMAQSNANLRFRSGFAGKEMEWWNAAYTVAEATLAYDTGNFATNGILAVSGAGTSTFSGGISADTFRASSTTASSTGENGWNLNAGCFAIRGTCIGGSSAASSFGYPWTTTTVWGTTTRATTTPEWFQTGLYASSTSQFTNSSTTNATMAAAWLTGQTAGQLLSLDASGKIVSTSTIGNGQLANSSLTVTCNGGLTGGGTISLGGSATCSISAPVSIANGGTNNTTLPLGLLWFDGGKIAGTSSQLTVGSLLATTSATSTFTGGLSFSRYLSTGTSTNAGLIIEKGGLRIPTIAAGSGSNCLQIDTNGMVTNTGLACGTPANTVANGLTGTTTEVAGLIVFGNGTIFTQSGNSSTDAFKWDNVNKRLGIGTTSPWAALSIMSGTQIPIVVSTTTGVALEEIDTFGHLIYGGYAPTIGTCGTSPAIQSPSNDNAGWLKVGSGAVNSCAFTFQSAWPIAPHCSVNFNMNAATATVIVASTTATTLTIKSSASNMGGALLDWQCAASQ